MVFPLLALALIGSSAIMVAPYANEELKKSQVAKSVVDKGATMREDYQSTKLKNYTGGDGLTSINPDYPTIHTQSWFMPAIFAGIALTVFLLVRK